jgi:hypothetical protein
MFHILDLVKSSDVQEEMFLFSWAGKKELVSITGPPDVQNNNHVYCNVTPSSETFRLNPHCQMDIKTIYLL